MRVKETKVFTFDELSDKAKERARDWYREASNRDNYWSENVLEDAQTIGAMLGIEFKTRAYKTVGGKERSEPCIYWSGFWSQGDGASFEGRYSFHKGGLRQLRAHAPQDAELDRIAGASYERANLLRNSNTGIRGTWRRC